MLCWLLFPFPLSGLFLNSRSILCIFHHILLSTVPFSRSSCSCCSTSHGEMREWLSWGVPMQHPILWWGNRGRERFKEQVLALTGAFESPRYQQLSIRVVAP